MICLAPVLGYGLTGVSVQCIELMGDGCLNNEHFEELGGILKAKLEEHFKNQELRQGESHLGAGAAQLCQHRTSFNRSAAPPAGLTSKVLQYVWLFTRELQQGNRTSQFTSSELHYCDNGDPKDLIN